VHAGTKHEYLGINFEFLTNRNLQVSMVAYLKDVIEGFPELIMGKIAAPTGDRLFDIQDEKDARPLEEEREIAFHHTMAHLLVMMTRACHNIQTAVAFLATRVKAPDKDNLGKLKCVLQYLNRINYLKLAISVGDLGILKWYVDGSHNVHWDCKGHAGAMFTLEEGVVSSYSRKLKSNTQSSTEAELVGADMYMPEMLWSLYFIQSQGYNVESIELYQDNKSKELLMKNGWFLSRKRTKHIKAKFFFIKDRVDSGEMRIEHQPTEKMWSNVLTKLLQGTALRQMGAKLMNYKVNHEEDEVAFEQSMAKAKHAKKATPATGRVTKQGPT
jgi:hypothetical protein